MENNEILTLIIPPARGICDDCLKNKDRRVAIGNMIVVYCYHNSSGAVMPILSEGRPSGIWRIYSPISLTLFLDSVSCAIQPETTLAEKSQQPS